MEMKKTILIVIVLAVLLVLGNALYAYLNNTTNMERVSVSALK